MGCCGQREKGTVSEQQKWDYITLSDFKAKSCAPVFSYCWLWILIFITIAVYSADTFTAVNLIGFNKWTSGLTPKINLKIAKWIFSGCIILSWTLAIYSWIVAFSVMRRGCVTDDYLDDLAVVLQSIRCGTGWQRFLVFTELTKSKKKVSWIALFVYFQRKGAIRLLFADGPRQVVNAITLWSVINSELVDPKDPNGVKRSGFDQFFYNLQILGQQDKKQIIILSSMAFTLIIWALFMIFLILALILYIAFLWHFIQNETLTGFCRRKVETRLARIVKAKTDKILAKQQLKWDKMERKGASQVSLASTLPPKFARQPTLPTIGGSPPTKSELYRSDSSTSTLPLYSSEPPTPMDGPGIRRAPTLPNIMEASGRPLPPSRSATGLTDVSYATNAPLLSQAGGMGYSGPISRPGTSNSQRSFNGSMHGQGRPSLPPLATQGQPGPRYPPPARSNTGFSMQSRESPMSAGTPYTPAGSGRPLLPGMSPYDNRTQSPAQHARGGSYDRGGSYEMTPVEYRGYDNDYFPPQQPQEGAYFRGPPRNQSQTPTSEYSSQASSAVGLPGALQIGGTRRDMSAPGPPRAQLPWPPTQRSATAPVPEDVRGLSRGPGPGYGMQRSATAGPREW